MHGKSAAGVALAALLTAACSTIGIPGLNTVTSRYADPIGDATASGGTVYDVTEVVTNRIDNPPGGAYDTLQVVITFNQTVVLPSPGSSASPTGNQLGNFIHIDADRNAATGFGDSFCGLEGLEFLVDGMVRLANGNYPVMTGTFFSTMSGEATPSVSGNVLTVSIPLSALGGDNGETNLVELAAQRFGGVDNLTDCAPGDPVAGTGGAVVTRQPAGSKGLKSR